MRFAAVVLSLSLVACGDDDSPVEPDAGCVEPFAVGSEGSLEPLGAGPGEARAGRLTAADLDAAPHPLLLWEPGDFVLANDRIAFVVEAVGKSDLYDPWGGRPVGMALVKDGKLASPASFGELLVLTNRETVVTDSVSVVADGADGGPVIVRASGRLRPLPFFEAITGKLFTIELPDVYTAIEYELAPDSNHVDIRYVYRSPRIGSVEHTSIMHGFMYGERMPRWEPGFGFDLSDARATEFAAFVDDSGASYTYEIPSGQLEIGISASGFTANFGPGFVLESCQETSRVHARITVGGPGLDGVLVARAA
jgi:hypothetical protein